MIRTQQLMRVLKTMNTVGEIKREDVLGMTMDTQQHQHQRSGNRMKSTYENCCCCSHLCVEDSRVHYECVKITLHVCNQAEK